MSDSRFPVPPLATVDRDHPSPLHRQIYRAYRDAIVDGRLRPGQKLPSTRALAGELGVSRMPVLEAFDQLLAEGYCEGRVGAGTFVADLGPEREHRADPAGAPAPSPPPGERPLGRGPSSALRRGPVWLRRPGAFALGEVAVDHFPFAAWGRMLAACGREPALTRYGPPEGHAPFREAIAAYLGAARGVRCDAEQVFVVSGSQQALEIAARVLLDPGSPVWIEDPGYFGFHRVLTACGARPVPVPVDEEGLDLEAGEGHEPRPRAIFVTPSHQFPLGVTMSARRRLHLLDFARERGAWIVEDDYNSEFRYESQPIASLQGLDRDDRVIYVGTFSKMLFPGLRIGYLVLPRDLADRFAAVRAAMDLCPPALLQGALTRLLGDGHFARHLRATRRLYRERRTELVAALRAELGDELEILGARAGMHVTVTFRTDVDDRAVARRAAEDGLWTLPLSDLCLGPERRGLVLGYGGVPKEVIPGAVRHLASAIAAGPQR